MLNNCHYFIKKRIENIILIFKIYLIKLFLILIKYKKKISMEIVRIYNPIPSSNDILKDVLLTLIYLLNIS